MNTPSPEPRMAEVEGYSRRVLGNRGKTASATRGWRFARWLALWALLWTASAGAAQPFVHPGLLQSREDLEYIRAAVAAKTEPIFSGYEVFRASGQSRSNYAMRGPLPLVGRNPTVGQREYDSDANAAYQCAIMWRITGDAAYAKKSAEIVNAWSATLKSITGRDAVLMAGLGPFKMVNAAELLRYTGGGLQPAEIERTEKHFREVIYPVIENFAPYANGNWDTAAIKTMMAIGVFCDDRAVFERALDYYTDGCGDGRLGHYIINQTGQCQESGRDQQHTQLGLAHLGDACEIAWHQGLDLYGCRNNLLLKGFEYTARYNLGEDVPFAETLDCTGKYHQSRISAIGRGRFRAVFEEIYNHYANRTGLDAPFTRRVLEQIRPERAGGPGADSPGYGTLLYARTSSRAALSAGAPAAPGGGIAQGLPDEIRLAWVPSIGARNYTIRRATGAGGYNIITRNAPTAEYRDTNVEAGQLYRYMASAGTPGAESPCSMPLSISAGLPHPWSRRDVGEMSAPGAVNFDGTNFRIEAAGADIGGLRDRFEFACLPVNRDGALSARYVPQTSSQFSRFGLMWRESPAAGAAGVALLISAEADRDMEEPGWLARMITRDAEGAAATVRAASARFSEPMVTFGRMTGGCWLKLERSGGNFTGSISGDGKMWTQVGTVALPLKRNLLAGLAACSGITRVATVVTFDSVSAPGWKEMPQRLK